MDNNPPPLFELSSRYTAPAQVTDEVYAAKKKAKRVVDRFSLPEGHVIEHEGTGIDRNGNIASKNFTSKLKRESDGYNAGTVNWDPRTGHVRGFYMDPDVSNYASHLLTAAHDYAAKEGVDGPTNSDEMTDYSYNMAKRLVPSSIPKNAMVADAPIHFRSEGFLSTLHSLKSQAHKLESETAQLDPSYARRDVYELPSAYIGAAIDAHHTNFHYEIGEHLDDAANYAFDLRNSLGTHPHPDAGEMSKKWRDFGNLIGLHVRPQRGGPVFDG